MSCRVIPFKADIAVVERATEAPVNRAATLFGTSQIAGVPPPA